MDDKRKRTLNFTSDEKAVLTELVIKYRTVLENKKSDATTNADKVNGWKRLCNEFNSLSNHCRRAPERLKTCWENIKRQTKKESATRKREIFKTGGGRPPAPPPSSGADRMIGTILGPALEGLENPYDGDALLDVNDKENVATQSTINDYTQMSSDTEFINHENEVMHVIEIMEDEPSCTQSQSPVAGTSLENKYGAAQTNFNIMENNVRWEGWTPSSLKRPVSDALKQSKGNSLLKRRRPAPDQQSLSDQLIQEKNNLVKTLIHNSQEESQKRILILEEQLKQEKIKTQKLL